MLSELSESLSELSAVLWISFQFQLIPKLAEEAVHIMGYEESHVYVNTMDRMVSMSSINARTMMRVSTNASHADHRALLPEYNPSGH